MIHPFARPYSAGPALITLGGALLLMRVFEFGGLEWPFLSAVLISLGALRRESAWFIPAGILAGNSVGAYLTDVSPLAATLSDEARDGVFLFACALGWVGVFTLSRSFGDTPNTWALIPALVMSVIGTLLLSAGASERVLEAAGYLWPLGLVALGAYLMLRAERS